MSLKVRIINSIGAQFTSFANAARYVARGQARWAPGGMPTVEFLENHPTRPSVLEGRHGSRFPASDVWNKIAEQPAALVQRGATAFERQSVRREGPKGWPERQVCYKIGSPLKGCAQCGETVTSEAGDGRAAMIFTSGFDVFRAYKPKIAGWTYLCMTCGARDEACWAGARDIGKEPRLLPSEQKRQKKPHGKRG